MSAGGVRNSLGWINIKLFICFERNTVSRPHSEEDFPLVREVRGIEDAEPLYPGLFSFF
jgi:hypothetical protein